MTARAVGIVTALPAEAATLREATGVMVDAGGMGARLATAAAERLVARGATGLASWGFAGGLDPSLRAGDLVVPLAVRDGGGERFPCDEQWRGRFVAALDVVEGEMLAAGAVVRSAEDKARAAAAGVVAVDLESVAIARVACAHGLPFVAVRAISDPADFALPHAALVAIDARGRLRPLALVGALIRRPREFGELVRLRSMSNAALATLRKAAAVQAQMVSAGAAG